MVQQKQQENLTQNSDKNYYDYLYNLRLFKSELLKIKTFEEIEIYLPKAMNYIYTKRTLLSIFKEQLDVFLNIEEYKSLYEKEYEKYKQITYKLAQKKGNCVNYNKNTVTVTFKEINKLLENITDIPIIYFYVSICFALSKQIDKNNLKIFKISDSILSIYENYNCQYGQINIPENLEFYVVTVCSFNNVFGRYKKYNMDKISMVYIKTCLLYVLNKLEKICKNKIDNEYFNSKGIILFDEINANTNMGYVKKEYFLIYTHNKKFKLDGKFLNLNDTLENTLKKFLQITEDETFFRYNKLTDSEKNVIKTHAKRINDVARKLIGQKLVEFDKVGNYRTLKNINFRNLNISDDEE